MALSKDEILQSVNHKPKKGIKCINHRKQAVVYCEKCGKPLCKECVVINWRSNFIENALMASKEKFVKDIVCKDCAKQVNKSQVVLSTFLLFLVLSMIMAAIIGAI